VFLVRSLTTFDILEFGVLMQDVSAQCRISGYAFIIVILVMNEHSTDLFNIEDSLVLWHSRNPLWHHNRAWAECLG